MKPVPTIAKSVYTEPVTKRALIARINRRLKADGQALRAARRSRGARFYLVNIVRNFIVNENADPERLGRELGVLERWEEVVG